MNATSDTIGILHVDDEPGFADMASAFLERADERFEVVTTHSPVDALERLETGEFDCVVSDYDMPEWNGIELLERVRELNTDLPFILFTNQGSEEIASDAISAGVTDYLQKGSKTERYELLANRIRNAVRARRTQIECRRQREAIETAREGIGVLGEGGHFVSVNRAYAQLYGYDPGELIGEHWSLLYREEEAERIREEVLSTVAQAGNWRGTTVGLRADGSTFLEDHSIARTDRGELVCTVRDVTEREEMRGRIGELQRETQRLIRARDREEVATVAVEIARDVLDLPLTGVHVVDDEREVLEPIAVTEQIREHLGEAPAYRRTDPSRSVDAFNWRVFEEGEPVVVENAREHDGIREGDTPSQSGIIHPLGDHGLFVTSSPEPNVFDESDVDLVELLATVVTAVFDRVERETQLRERTRLLRDQTARLDEFASVVSHDLRNPLTVATARLELAREECESDHLAVVERSHDRMETLLEDLLTLAREDDVSIDAEPVELRELVDRCWTTVETGESTVRVETDLVVRADVSRLKQLFENLFRNAVEHGGDGVTVTVGELPDGFFVEDDGRGIPPEERDRVFETGYTTSQEGTGLGLNIVEKVVEAHDWAIAIADGADGGARFEITDVDGSSGRR